MIRIKICGITQAEDALLACELGADAIGFIFYEKSLRWITLERAAAIVAQLPEHVARVGVFVTTPPEEIRRYIECVHLTAVQFHGEYDVSVLAQFPEVQVIAVARVRELFQARELEKFHKVSSAILLDTYQKGRPGGTGATFDWQAAIDAKAYGRIILAGGLNPENVQQAAETVQPYALDISSGVEASPGKKDHARLRQLFNNLQEFRSDWQAARPHLFPER